MMRRRVVEVTQIVLRVMFVEGKIVLQAIEGKRTRKSDAINRLYGGST